MKQLLVGVFCLLGIASQAQTIDSAWVINNYTKQEVYITMRDGVKLFTSIYTPKNKAELHPILMTRTPYSCQPYGATAFLNYWDNYQKNI